MNELDRAIEAFFEKKRELNRETGECIKNILEFLGYKFSCDTDYYSFLKKRVTMVRDIKTPFYVEFYIDFQTETERFLWGFRMY